MFDYSVLISKIDLGVLSRLGGQEFAQEFAQWQLSASLFLLRCKDEANNLMKKLGIQSESELCL